MSSASLDPRRTALLIVDVQNDIVSAGGAYDRAGVCHPDISSLPRRLRPLVERMRASGCAIVASLFTFVPGRGGVPIIPEQIRRNRPFLKKGDFEPGQWGHALVDELAPADFTVEKIAYSAFYMSRLEWVLHQIEADFLVVAGVATNLSVTATVKDALKRDFKVLVLEDGCAAFDGGSHRTGLSELAIVAPVRSGKDVCSMLS